VRRRDAAVRLEVYRQLLDHQRAPEPTEVTAALHLPAVDVQQSLRRLAEGRALVLEGDGVRVRKAEPFSAVATPFRVTAGPRSWWANCAWDALGIPAMLHADATAVSGVR